MESFPTFHDPAKFPAFSVIPLATQDPNAATDSTFSYSIPPDLKTAQGSSSESGFSSPYFLIGTISENMTLGINPTFICKDRDMVPFAVTIKLDATAKGGNFDVKSCKKGYTMAIRDAKKYGAKEGKQGFIETTMDKIKVSRPGDFLLTLSNGWFW